MEDERFLHCDNCEKKKIIFQKGLCKDCLVNRFVEYNLFTTINQVRRLGKK